MEVKLSPEAYKLLKHMVDTCPITQLMSFNERLPREEELERWNVDMSTWLTVAHEALQQKTEESLQGIKKTVVKTLVNKALSFIDDTEKAE